MGNLESKFDYNQISILSVAQRCGVAVLRSGHYHIAHCPFHAGDRDPSLVFYPNSNSWACFGKCQGRNGRRNGGDTIAFIKQYYSYSYGEAVEWLKRNFELIEITEPLNIKPKEPPKPVPHPWVIYWHSLMDDAHRKYFQDRGFKDSFIDTELWGWDGHRFTLPVWSGEPSNSEVLGVRRRKVDGQKGEKYIGLKDMNPPTVWGRWYCQNQKSILAFAGEFDAALAVQDGFSAFSIVNGINGFSQFPKEWPEMWFPDSENLIAVFDKNEFGFAAMLCGQWNKIKGWGKAKVFAWPISLNIKDYCEFRTEHNMSDFKLLFDMQGLDFCDN